MERITLNLIPKGYKTTCHVSQFDNGRLIQLDLLEGSAPYVLKEGDAVSLKVLKPDGVCMASSLPAVAEQTFVILTVTSDMSDLDGRSLCELRVTNGSTDVGSADFYMEVKKSVEAVPPVPGRQGGLSATERVITSTTYETL